MLLITVTKSSARRQRVTSRRNQAEDIKGNFNETVWQINFDGKLLPRLQGLGNANRLGVGTGRLKKISRCYALQRRRIGR